MTALASGGSPAWVAAAAEAGMNSVAWLAAVASGVSSAWVAAAGEVGMRPVAWVAAADVSGISPTLLAFAAGTVAVFAAWDLLGVAQRAPVGRIVGGVLAPVRDAGRHGDAPTAPEQRRLALLATGALLVGGWLVGGAVLAVPAALAGPSASVAAVRARRRRYSARLQAGAAEAARALADAVSSGHAVRGAIAAAAPGVRGAAGRELAVTAAGLALGEPTEAALQRLRRRAGCRAWDTLVAALLLQREAGGDLAGLLRRLAASLDAAARAEADARSATAQARFTAYLVAGLPVAGLVFAELGSPGFLVGLLGDPLSAVLAGCALVLQATAIVAVKVLSRRGPA